MSRICNLGYRRILLFMFLSIAQPLLFACSGGNDTPPQATAPPPPQATGQPGRFDAPIIAMAPVPNGNGTLTWQVILRPTTTKRCDPWSA